MNEVDSWSKLREAYSELHDSLVQGFLDLAKSGKISRETILQGYELYTRICDFDKTDSSPYNYAGEVYRGLINPEYDPYDVWLLDLTPPTDLLKGLNWNKRELDKATKFCEAMLEIRTRKELDHAFPIWRRKIRGLFPR